MAKNAGVKNCHVVEVGAGPGSLTRSIILEGCDEIDCVEVDKRLIPLLEVYYIKLLLSLKSSTQTPMRINLKDIFKFDIGEALSSIQRVPWIDETVLPKARILGNLPFNISIGLLLQWLKAVSERRGPFQLGRIPMYLTFQKEVADNLTCKNMGDTSRLTMMTQAFCSSRQVQFIHRSHFVPIPKVDSVFVELIPRAKPQVNVTFDILEQVVKGAFQHRGKYIFNSLKLFFNGNDDLARKLLIYADIDPCLHTRMLAISDWSRLCDSYVRLMKDEELPLIVQPMKSPCPIIHTDLD